MKKVNQLLFAATVAAILSFAGQANAQFKVNEDDGIAASPKVRQMLNERKAPRAAAAVAKNNSASGLISYSPVGADGIAASPKVRQALEEKRASTVLRTPAQDSTSVAYHPVRKDGIAASPKVRQQLDERPGAFMVAPVK